MRKGRKRQAAWTNTFPSGSFVTTPAGDYLIQDGSRLRVASDAVKKSWAFSHSIFTNEENLKTYPIVGKLGFRAGTVFWSLEDGLYYLVEKNKKRQIINGDWFTWLGIDRLNVPAASYEDAKLHKTGEVLN